MWQYLRDYLENVTLSCFMGLFRWADVSLNHRLFPGDLMVNDLHTTDEVYLQVIAVTNALPFPCHSCSLVILFIVWCYANKSHLPLPYIICLITRNPSQQSCSNNQNSSSLRATLASDISINVLSYMCKCCVLGFIISVLVSCAKIWSEPKRWFPYGCGLFRILSCPIGLLATMRVVLHHAGPQEDPMAGGGLSTDQDNLKWPPLEESDGIANVISHRQTTLRHGSKLFSQFVFVITSTYHMIRLTIYWNVKFQILIHLTFDTDCNYYHFCSTAFAVIFNCVCACPFMKWIKL